MGSGPSAGESSLPRNVGRIGDAAVIVLELVQAATAAAVAQRFPTAPVELANGFPRMRGAVMTATAMVDKAARFKR